jgi:hypothetical protein
MTIQQRQREVADPRIPRLIMGGVVGADSDGKRIVVTLSGDEDQNLSIFKVNNFVPVAGETCVILAQGSRMVALGMISDYTSDGSGAGEGPAPVVTAFDDLSDVDLTGVDKNVDNVVIWDESLEKYTLVPSGSVFEDQITVSSTAPSAPALNDLWVEIP